MESLSPKKNRRRFLADMLFVGGGLTAAAVLAKTTFLEELTPQPPATVGEMVAPPPLEPTPAVHQTPDPTECSTPEPEISKRYVRTIRREKLGDPAPRPHEQYVVPRKAKDMKKARSRPSNVQGEFR